MSSHNGPRPILKRDLSPTKQITNPLPFSACGPISTPHVHFPSTPGLTSTHAVYSPATYDRKPILVSPNICELRHGRKMESSPPAEFEIEHTERRGRSTSRDRSRSQSQSRPVKGSYFHPRAYEACEPEPPLGSAAPPSLKPPALVHDVSPSSEEDDVVTPPDHSSSSGVPWSVKRDCEEVPILSDVYATQAPVYTVSSTRRDGRPWEMPPEGMRQRPSLKRMAHQASMKRVAGFSSPQFSPHLDEGCLGGF
ncbi:hypothetical protein EUX98_g6952 [Antrodiella citrinella]|uniref:Uncharacterized protein n=1 Tax=Antrodiella citrinella TaxID=2447956 RepID=A0A4S4MNJ4_9APHY|nr:hypothetical protein EUX98_g6952 [Antrodiella citrinella]